MEDKRQFLGIWIPKEIWLSEELTLQEKVFYVEIQSLDNENGCFANNEYFSKFFGLSKSRVSEIINSLEKKGFIFVNIDQEKGNKRVIKTTNTYEQKPKTLGAKTEDPYKQNPKYNNISNNNINNKYIYIEIFNFRNSLNIVNHTKQPDNLEKLLDKKIKKYSIDEIKQTMQKYAEVVLSKKYWFNYKWTLSEFLSRKTGFDVWFDIPKENYLIGGDFGRSKIPQNALKDEVNLGEMNFSKITYI